MKEEQKRNIIKKKGSLKERRKERICEDWTWRERMRWKLNKIANEEQRKGKRV